jgi:hypothetical protein
MSTLKPLKALLEQADELIRGSGAGLSKEASTPDQVSALAELLAGADTETTVEYDPSETKQAEIDKIAESLNRVQTAAELDMFFKLAHFEKRASEEGYSKEQVSEAMSKIAASKIAQSLPILAAMGFVGVKGEDKNSLPKTPSGKSQGKLLGRLNMARSMGY